MKELVDHYEGFVLACNARSAETVATYRRALRPFLNWFAVDKRCFFRQRDVERYRGYLLDKRGLKPVSVGTYLTALRRFCEYLIEIDVLKINPATNVAGSSRPQKHSRTHLSRDEVRLLLDSIDRSSLTGLRDYAIVHVMLGCALSERECLLADVGDIVRGNRSAFIRVQGKGRPAKDETVRIPADARRALEHYVRERYGAGPDQDWHHLADEPLFTTVGRSAAGYRLSARGMRAAIHRWLTESGVKSGRSRTLTPFSLRHTAGMIMVENGASVEDLMARMRIEWRPTAQLYFTIRRA